MYTVAVPGLYALTGRLNESPDVALSGSFTASYSSAASCSTVKRNTAFSVYALLSGPS